MSKCKKIINWIWQTIRQTGKQTVEAKVKHVQLK